MKTTDHTKPHKPNLSRRPAEESRALLAKAAFNALAHAALAAHLISQK